MPAVRYMLDTNIVSGVVKNPDGALATLSHFPDLRRVHTAYTPRSK